MIARACSALRSWFVPLAQASTLLACAGLCACTSFGFEKGGTSSAPSALQDRSTMIPIPPGTFLMGTAHGEPDEYPLHEVTISGLLVDRTEVDVGNYRACVEAGVCRASAFAADPILGRDRHPVVGVTWRDAVKYCGWVGKRLPTEAEWEYAARLPTFSPFPWEGRFAPTKANGRGTVDGYPKTAPVGSFPEGKSVSAILDMAGNAAEWTSDWFDGAYYGRSEKKDPKGPSAPTGQRTVRGGSWADPPHVLRSMSRQALDPNASRDSVGFRCVVSSATQ